MFKTRDEYGLLDWFDTVLVKRLEKEESQLIYLGPKNVGFNPPSAHIEGSYFTNLGENQFDIVLNLLGFEDEFSIAISLIRKEIHEN